MSFPTIFGKEKINAAAQGDEVTRLVVGSKFVLLKQVGGKIFKFFDIFKISKLSKIFDGWVGR